MMYLTHSLYRNNNYYINYGLFDGNTGHVVWNVKNYTDWHKEFVNFIAQTIV